MAIIDNGIFDLHTEKRSYGFFFVGVDCPKMVGAEFDLSVVLAGSR